MAAAEGRHRGRVRRAGPVVDGRATGQHDEHPRPAAGRPGRPGRQPRLVQGELAAPHHGRAPACPTSVRCSRTCRSTPAAGSPGASTRSRGTSWSRWPPGGSSAPGSTCGRGSTSAAPSPPSSGPETAVFVPRGVGNAFQTLADGTVYSYLVNDHWSPAAKDSYTFVNLADETLAIAWPIPLEDTDRSAADLAHPRLADVVPMRPKPVLVVGASGQLGQSLTAAWPEAEGIGRHGLDLSRPESVADVRPLPVRGGGQRRRLHEGGRRRERPGPARGLDGQRGRGGRPGPRGPRAPLHAGAHLLGLRLRRPEREPRRAGAVLAAGGVRPDQGRRRRAWSRPGTGTTCCGPAG